MSSTLISRIAGESEENRAEREQLTKQLDVLRNGLETCKKFAGFRASGGKLDVSCLYSSPPCALFLTRFSDSVFVSIKAAGNSLVTGDFDSDMESLVKIEETDAQRERETSSVRSPPISLEEPVPGPEVELELVPEPEPESEPESEPEPEPEPEEYNSSP